MILFHRLFSFLRPPWARRSTRSEPVDWVVVSARLTAEHSQVYANGRQQSRVTITFEPRFNNEPYALTESELESIRLIDYSNEAIIPLSDHESGNYRGWSAQRNHRGWEFLSDRAHAINHAHPQNRITMIFFISAAVDVDPLKNPISLGFYIVAENRSRHYTTGWRVDADGVRHRHQGLDSGTDRHQVNALPPVAYNAANFALLRRPLPGPGVDPTAGIFNAVVTVSLTKPDGSPLGIRQFYCTPAGMIHWINNLATTSNPCFTGYAIADGSAIQWNADVPTGDQALPTNVGSPDRDKGMIVLCGRVDIPRGDYTIPPTPVGPIFMNMIDAYGSPQTRRLQFVAGQRDELEIV